jgi:hypothetical protein
MDKKKQDVYEQLAKVYLQPGENAKPSSVKADYRSQKPFFIISAVVVLIVCLLVYSSVFIRRTNNTVKQLSLIIQPGIVKLSYDFHSIQKKTCTFELEGLNVSDYQYLNFSVRKANPHDIVHLKVELVNSYRETSCIYLQDIDSKWRNFRIDLNDFKQITDFSRLKQLSFVVEEFNAKEKRGKIYIEGIGFTKQEAG